MPELNRPYGRAWRNAGWMLIVVWCCCGGLHGEFTARALAQAIPKAKSVGKWVEPKTLISVWMGGKMKLPGRPDRVENYEPEAYPAADPSAKLASIKLPNIEANEESTCLIVNPKCQRALIGYWKPGKSGAGTTRLVMCDLAAGTVMDSFVVPTAAVPMALSDNGEHIAVRFLPEAGPGQESHLEVWGWSDKGITREVRFLPHDDALQLKERFTFARFLDDTRVAALTTQKQLIIWEWRTAKLLWIFDKYVPFCDISLSANRKYLFATARNTSLAVINTSTFDFAGYYSPRGSTDDFRIHPSGSQVMANSYDMVNRVGEAFVTTIPNDRMSSFFEVSQLGLGRLLAFPNDDYVLYEAVEKPPETNKPGKPEKTAKTKPTAKSKAAAKKSNQSVGTIVVQEIDEETGEDFGLVTHRIDSTKVTTGKVALVDLQYRVRTWEYTGVDRLAGAGPQCWCLTRSEKGQTQSLVPLVLPGPELKEQVAKVVVDPEYFLLKDGGVVKVDLAGLPAKDRDAAIPVLEKQLQQNKVKIGDTSDLELVAKVGPYRVKEVMSLAQVGNQALIGHHTHRQLTVNITLLLKGQPVYSNVLTNNVSLLDKQPGETSQQYYDRNPGTPLEILKMLSLPKIIFGPKGNKPLGTTNLAQVEKSE